jgi:hypothetical protein
MADQTTIRTPRGVTKDQFLDMVRLGTHDAVVELMRAGSNNPGADFFSAVRDGIREAVRAVVREHAMTERQEAQEQKSGDEPPRGDPSSQP